MEDRKPSTEASQSSIEFQLRKARATNLRSLPTRRLPAVARRAKAGPAIPVRSTNPIHVSPSFLAALSPLIERQPQLAVVGTANDGLAAIELADELTPDAVVIDLHMPRLDGVSAVARLRRDHPSMCVIALTGDEHPALHEAVTEAGADAVLMKEEFVDVLVDRLAAARASL